MLTYTRIFAIAAAVSGLTWAIALGTFGGLGGGALPLALLALAVALTLWFTPPDKVLYTIGLAWIGSVGLMALLMSPTGVGLSLVWASLLFGTLATAAVLLPAGIAAVLYQMVAGRRTS